MAMDSPPRVALVTGAAKRIGAAIVRSLHTQGYCIALHHRHSPEEAEALAAELNAQRRDSVRVLQADLAEFDRLPELIAQTVGPFGRLDALINNASEFFPTPIGESTPHDWQRLFASNAFAPFFLSQAAAPHLKATGGCIINMVDIYAQRPLKNHTLYCMAKASLAMMTQSLAKELGPEVRVNGIAPGAILWPEQGIDNKAMQAMLANSALKRSGHPDDIVQAVLWLLHHAAFTTGHILPVSGGREVY